MLGTAQLVATAVGVLLIAAEIVWSRRGGRHGYPVADSVCDAVIAVIIEVQDVRIHADERFLA